jgi:hypothetical protein
MAHPHMKGVWRIVQKIQASIEGDVFPMEVSELDRRIADYGLTTSERIALKSSMVRAGLLK